ncbi:hypothetical protein EYR36_004081 [Pleurotus pulmonarius]|nr:hypothetical protein EYR36_004081 [Pleurotus pulmonarius]KAF4581635.1 hypothetical protein EYR38_002964 [Pleurotus pulmonarius]
MASRNSVRGSVSNTNGPARRGTIQLYEADSTDPVETTTFIENPLGRNGELVLETTHSDVWFYSAQAKGAYVKISIEVDHADGKFEYLNTMKPHTVRQAPTASSKADFYLSAILADDVPDKGKGAENYSFDDGIVTVLEYK